MNWVATISSTEYNSIIYYYYGYEDFGTCDSPSGE